MWDWAIWAALIPGVPAGTTALALLALRLREALRTFEDTRQSVVRGLDELARRAEETAGRVAAVEDTAELQESLARLRVSLARLAVLRDALAEAQLSAGRVTAFVPRP
jgi:hypothetical protein